MSTVTVNLPANVNTITPLSEDVGGTGVSNPLGNTLSLGGPLVTTSAVTLNGPINLKAPLSGKCTGPLALTLTAVTGCSALTFVAATAIDAVSTSVGSKVNIVCQVQLTASASGPVFNITLPISTTGVFVDNLQANGIGIVTSGGGLGSLASLASNPTTRNIQIALALGSSSGPYTAQLMFSYFVN